MKHKWSKMTLSFTAIDPNDLGDVQQLSDAELKIELEKKDINFKKIPSFQRLYL